MNLDERVGIWMNEIDRRYIAINLTKRGFAIGKQRFKNGPRTLSEGAQRKAHHPAYHTNEATV